VVVATFNTSDDTTISQANPTINYGGTGCDTMTVGYTGVNSASRSLIKFNLASIPAGATIISASLYLDLPLASPASGAGTVNIHRVTTAFTEGTQCANAGSPNWTSPWTAAGGDYNATVYGTAAYTNGQNSSVNVDVTSLVQYWVSTANNGALLKLSSESGSTYVIFNTGEAGGIGTRPVLSVTYRL
jgi:hypothetical protein